jgi:hypothetical protein
VETRSYLVLRGEESAADERITDGLVAEAVMSGYARRLPLDGAAKLGDQ